MITGNQKLESHNILLPHSRPILFHQLRFIEVEADKLPALNDFLMR
jgi:hypothetical protein